MADVVVMDRAAVVVVAVSLEAPEAQVEQVVMA
jgi:hypothetical protein